MQWFVVAALFLIVGQECACFLVSRIMPVRINAALAMGGESDAAAERAARRAARAAKLEEGLKPEGPKYIVGEDLPPEIVKLMKEPIYDMILVERYSAPESTVTGIYLPPGPEGKDRRHLGQVLGIPSYGLESEQGRLQAMNELIACGEPALKVGDVVYLKDDWGIGPKNIEVGERKFSFHKALNVIGIVR